MKDQTLFKTLGTRSRSHPVSPLPTMLVGPGVISPRSMKGISGLSAGPG